MSTRREVLGNHFPSHISHDVADVSDTEDDAGDSEEGYLDEIHSEQLSESSEGNESDTSSDSGGFDGIGGEAIVTSSTGHYGGGDTGEKDGYSTSTSSSSSSSREMEDSEMEGIMPDRQRKRKRRKSSVQFRPQRHDFRSPSPFCDWIDANGVATPSAIEESGNESHLPSDLPDSGSDFEWDSFIDDCEMLPVSNYQAEFLQLQAEFLGSFTYKGLTAGDELDEMEDPDNAVWYPCDPDDFSKDFQRELSGNNLEDEYAIICYGIIHEARVKVLPQAPRPLNLLHTDQVASDIFKQQGIYVFKLPYEKDGEKFLLQSPSASQQELADNIAVLNRETSGTLSELMAFCTFEAYSSSQAWAPFMEGLLADEKENHVLIDVVVYGPPNVSNEVGDLLTARRTYLQEPDYWKQGLGYNNPHFLDLTAVQAQPNASTLDPLSSSLLQMGISFQTDLSEEQATSQKLLKQRIAAAFKGMTRAQNLRRITADIRISTPLMESQEQALDFIMQRESGPISEEYCLWKSKDSTKSGLFTHVITGAERHDIPREIGGGILADDMGLGKTLTMLAAIIRTADEAKAFSDNAHTDLHLSAEYTLIPSRATLVVVPSPLLLNEWREEIDLHCTGFSDIIVYHGPGRQGDPKSLADSDIVLSTYHTISHEASDKQSPLWKIRWFRVILDEAHIIRRMTTKLFKAMKKLRANFRWCLTGTPVQNGLDDLAALISFIRSSPLDELSKFRKHVIKPLMKKSENGIENLRYLLDSLCLRRTKDLLNLPEAFYETRALTFSPKEEQYFIETRDRLIKLIHQNRNQPNSKNSYLGVFQLQLQLRRLCNHGTFQKILLSSDEFDPEQAISLLKKQKEAKCAVCSTEITGVHGIEETRSGCFTVCGHLLCMHCIPKMKLALQSIAGQDEKLKCSLCQESFLGEYLIVDEATSAAKSGPKRLSAWQYFAKDGCSTKVSEVVEDICKHKTDGKSIVFSCWTRSLDLIGMFLQSRSIPFVRIDGSHTLVQRKWILQHYQKDPAIKILLMTTGTGAIGLNLTVANCVYLLEPQWNPMVEDQAIARVLRLGQKRNVKVVRYVMKGTLEEAELQSRQKLKRGFASLVGENG